MIVASGSPEVKRSPRRNIWRRAVFFAASWVLALLLTIAGDRLGLVAPFELAVGDYWHRIAGVREPARQVALVVIDDATLATFRDDPMVFWTPHVARAVEVLRMAGATVIGLDLMFSISPENWLDRHAPPGASSNFDAPLRREIASGQLIMVASAAHSDEGHSQFLLPAAEFLLAVPDLDLTRHIGLADLLQDADGAIRHFVVAPATRMPENTAAGMLPRLSFAALLAARASGVWPTMQPDGKEGLRLSGRSYQLNGQPYPIAYPGPPGHIPRISFARLMEPAPLSDPAVKALKGRVIIIGGEYAGMNDTHATPYVSGFFRGDGRYMTGPEVHAGIVEALLTGRLPSPLPAGATILVVGAWLAVALFLFLRLRLMQAVLSLPLLAGAAALMAYVLFLNYRQFPLAALMAGMTALFLGVLGLRFFFEEHDRRRITGLFGRYVSDQVVEELIASGRPPQLGGVRMTLTVLFSDIRNFTVISEMLTAEEVVEMLNRYFSEVCRIILEEGGTIDKFIGDAVMVQFGAPVPYPDHADRALRAALRIRQAAHDFVGWMEERFSGRRLPEFAIGIGVHTGQAIIGNIGSERHTEYTAIGDTVNTASRIEGMTKELGCIVLASAETIATCRLPVETGNSQTVRVKGKSTPLVLYEVRAAGKPD